MFQPKDTDWLLLLLLLSRFSCVRLCVTPWTAAHQAPPSLGFSRQEHWSGLPFPSPTDWLKGYKNKTHIYAAYKKPTSDLKIHKD